MPEDLDEEETFDFVKIKYEAKSGFSDTAEEMIYSTIRRGRSIDKDIPDELKSFVDMFFLTRAKALISAPAIPIAPTIQPARRILDRRQPHTRYIPLRFLEADEKDEEETLEEDEDFEDKDQSERDREDSISQPIVDE